MMSVSLMVLWSVSLAAMAQESFRPVSVEGETAQQTNSRMPQTVAEMDNSNAGEWLDSFEEARRLAIEKNIPVVLHFEAVWCGACRQMESAVLSQPAVMNHLGTTIVGLRVDADRDPLLIAKYGISSLPTEVVIGSDGQEIARYTGSATLDEYMTRLSKSGAINAAEHGSKHVEGQDESLRQCLLVMRDGKVVGLGGYCPVAMIRDKKWLKGSDEFVGTYDGVDYFFKSAEERENFFASPKQYIPGLHGCDPVELQRERVAQTGAIELGAFYKGRLYFFRSQSNRRLFQNNPAWYAEGVSSDGIQNPSQFPFLNSMNLN
ncbi:MAG: thioredoxin family protein [Planctomycetota bacterium]|nr:thioredoxin family protein [Planctomycetota bacterium]